MQLIVPLDEATIKAYVGNTVLAVTHDGMEYVGKLSGISNGTLLFNDNQEPSSASAKSKGKRAGIRSGKGAKSKAASGFAAIYAAALEPENPDAAFDQPFKLELAGIAYLFLL